MVNIIDPYLVRDLALTKFRMTQFLETIKTENNMERSLKLSVEQAQKLYAEQPTMRELLLTTFSKEELEGVVLKDWSELEGISGYFIESDSGISTYRVKRGNPESHCKNTFATMKQAKSSLAMAQLSQLMKDLGSECEVDWVSGLKYCINRYKEEVRQDDFLNNYCFLAFNTAKMRDTFAKKHERLIKDYFMLD